MSESSLSSRRKKQLGLSFSTARNRLHRLIIFDLVKKLGVDYCFRCKKKLVSVEDFSIDHKIPWMNVASSLFWDIENIAFSHIKCNSGVSSGNIVGIKVNIIEARNIVKRLENESCSDLAKEFHMTKKGIKYLKKRVNKDSRR